MGTLCSMPSRCNGVFPPPARCYADDAWMMHGQTTLCHAMSFHFPSKFEAHYELAIIIADRASSSSGE
eukprot:5456649-Amphidinium_carterae.1